MRRILLTVFVSVLYLPSNPSPDFSIAMMQVIAFACLFVIWHSTRIGIAQNAEAIVLLIVICLLCFRLGALTAILFGVHSLTDYLMSGYPFYPSSFGRVSALLCTAYPPLGLRFVNEVDSTRFWQRGYFWLEH